MTSELAWPPTKEDLERLYVTKKLSAAKIANEYGLKYASPKTAESTILHHLKKNGITRRDRSEHIRKVTTPMVDEWAERYEKGESLKKIAGDGFSPATVFYHLRSRGIHLRDKAETQIKAVTKYPRQPFTGTEIERAYLIGFVKGDCQALMHGRAVRVRTSTTHPAMSDLFSDLFGKHGFVKRYPRKSVLRPYEWNLEVDLDRTFDFLLIKIEDVLAEIGRSPSFFLGFFSGFFDAEGSIYFHRKDGGGGFEITVANTNAAILLKIKQCLMDLGHNSKLVTENQKEGRFGYTKAGKISRLRIWRFEDVTRILEMIRLRHAEKIMKTDIAISYARSSNFEFRKQLILKWDRLRVSITGDRDMFVQEAMRRYQLNQAVRQAKSLDGRINQIFANY